MKKIIPAAFFIIVIFASCRHEKAEPCFTYSPSAITTSTPVTFNASCTQNHLGNFVWTFGDGHDTALVSSTITHTYSTAGTYTVILEVTNEAGFNKKDEVVRTQQTITVQ